VNEAVFAGIHDFCDSNPKKLLYLGSAPDHLRPVKDRYWLISAPPSRRESPCFECQQATLEVLFVG
jgi:hypothetical protein